MKLLDMRVTKEIANALTPYFSTGKSVVSEVIQRFTFAHVKVNYTVKQGDLEKALWGFLITWLKWNQSRKEVYILPFDYPNRARNMCWVIKYYRGKSLVDFIFYSPVDETRKNPYLRLRLSLYKNKIIATRLEE